MNALRPAPDSIDTPRLRLLRLRPEHEAWVRALYAHVGVMQFIQPGGRTTEQSTAILAQMQAQWNERGFGYYVVVSREGEFLGCCLLVQRPNGVEFGYAIVESAWGRGYATEAGRAVLEVAFATVGVPDLFARVMRGNDASVEVLRKLGFSPAAPAPEGLRFGLTREAYLASMPALARP